jgi:hypothetical protein
VSHAIADDHGLVCAFRMAPLAPVGDDVLAGEPAGPLWLHFNLANARARSG